MDRETTMHIEAGGGTIDYQLDGPAGAPVVIFSHSLATHAGMWDPQVAPLRDRYRLLRYDTRGHGASSAPAGPYTLAGLAADARALLDRLGIEKAHWVGLSMGGMIGQEFALAYPHRLLSLSLCDTTGRVPPEAAPAWIERIDTARARGMDPLVEPTIERWFSAEFRTRHLATVDAVRAMIRATPVAGYIGCCQAIMHHDCNARLAAIRAPTLVIVGEDDPGTPVSAAKALQQAISDARLTILPKALHLSNIEAAPAFNAALGAHLDAR
jgi:3-oxoadipate enol-lactonase